jgi:hypothetical protein
VIYTADHSNASKILVEEHDKEDVLTSTDGPRLIVIQNRSPFGQIYYKARLLSDSHTTLNPIRTLFPFSPLLQEVSSGVIASGADAPYGIEGK